MPAVIRLKGDEMTTTIICTLVLCILLAAACMGSDMGPIHRRQADIQIIARTIWAEARSDGSDGMLMVASVIHNRARGRPDEMAVVCMRKRQFSCWNRGMTIGGLFWLDAVDPRLMAPADREAWGFSLTLAELLMDKTFHPTDPTIDHYHTKRVKPIWADKMRFVMEVGSHRVYSSKPERKVQA